MFGSSAPVGKMLKLRRVPFVLLFYAVASAAPGAPASAQGQGKPSRAEIEAKLARLFPSGHRVGYEGVIKLGGQFRTVAMRSWEQCRAMCRKNPWAGDSGCLLWTFTKAADPQMPNTCRMWWELTEMRENPVAISGPGTLK
jgi:hypothetical protein